MLVKALKLEAREGRTFTDTEQHWAAEAISTAHEHGLINGYSDTDFGPNDSITREQIARILQQAFQIQSSGMSSGSFLDQSNISPWAIEAVNALAQQGVLTGYSDQRFLPKQGATRAEAAVILMRALQLQSKYKSLYWRRSRSAPVSSLRSVSNSRTSLTKPGFFH